MISPIESPAYATPQSNQLDDQSVFVRLVDFLWRSPSYQEAVVKGTRGWQRRIASLLGVEPEEMQSALTVVGWEAFLHIISECPAGDYPRVVQFVTENASTHTSCLHGTGTCTSCLHGTGTCNTCAACYMGPDMDVTSLN